MRAFFCGIQADQHTQKSPIICCLSPYETIHLIHSLTHITYESLVKNEEMDGVMIKKTQVLSNSLMLLAVFLNGQALAKNTVYEDASDGSTDRWEIFDRTPTGATITNVFDADKNSRVIELNGNGADNGYWLGNRQGRTGAWNNTQAKIIQWDMRFAESFYIYVSVRTQNGHRYILYTPSTQGNDYTEVVGVSTYIHYGLGSVARNGAWQTITRDVEADLKTFEPENAILSINAFLVRGSGRIDNVQLLTDSLVGDDSGVLLTFDDRSVDLWYDYFKDKDASIKATFFVHGWHVLRDDEVEKLRVLQSRGHEIGVHSYSHKGVIRDYGGDDRRIQEYLDKEIIPALKNMRADGFDPVNFAFPYGETTDSYNAAIQPYFRSLRTTTYSGSTRPLETLDPIYSKIDELDYLLSGDGFDSAIGNDVPEITRAFDRAKSNGEIITLIGHRIYPDNDPGADFVYGVRVSVLDQIIEAAKTKGLTFYTVKDVFKLKDR